MLDIEELIDKIIKLLLPLHPNKIILFGSYAYGKPTDESDIDLFLIKNDLTIDEARSYEVKAHMSLRDLIKQYKIGFDILSASANYINNRDDYFYKIDILQNGKVIYRTNQHLLNG